MALEHLIEHRIVAKESFNQTDHALQELREMGVGSKRLGPCPSELKGGSRKWSLVSLYVQSRRKAQRRRGSAAAPKKYVTIGVFCVNCGHHGLKPELIAT